MLDEGLLEDEAAYRLLRRDILTTRLRPGAPLKLSALRNSYCIGWTPCRSAVATGGGAPVDFPSAIVALPLLRFRASNWKTCRAPGVRLNCHCSRN